MLHLQPDTFWCFLFLLELRTTQFNVVFLISRPPKKSCVGQNKVIIIVWNIRHLSQVDPPLKKKMLVVKTKWEWNHRTSEQVIIIFSQHIFNRNISCSFSSQILPNQNNYTQLTVSKFEQTYMYILRNWQVLTLAFRKQLFLLNKILYCQ